MGCSGSKDPVSAESKNIDKGLKKDAKESLYDYKLLLLGAGESGKSTFAKQIKLIYGGDFTDAEKLHMKEVIFENVVYSLRSLLDAANSNNITLKDETNALAAPFLEGSSITIDAKLGADIAKIQNDPAFKTIFEKYNTFHLIDSAEYFLSNIIRISDPAYLPSKEDMLRCRAKTTGIQETSVKDQKNKYTIIDVGGQRSERKKWVHCFQEVTAVIFFVAMSEYDLYLYEDDTTNRMHESLKLFDEICNSKWFESIPIILFLNKKDLFLEKIQKKNITVAFPHYEGAQNWDEASAYIKEQFESLHEKKEPGVYAHFTQATDTDMMGIIFNSVKNVMMQQNATDILT
jgi:GTPase SAR1 family protein